MPTVDANLAAEILAEGEALHEKRAWIEAQLRAVDERCRQLIEAAASSEIKKSHAQYLLANEDCRSQTHTTETAVPAYDNTSTVVLPQLALFPRKA
jgi:predicted transcriptional regulator